MAKRKRKSEGPEVYGWEEGVQIGATQSGDAVVTVEDLKTAVSGCSFEKYFDLDGAACEDDGVFIVKMRRAEYEQARKAGGMVFEDRRCAVQIEVPFP